MQSSASSSSSAAAAATTTTSNLLKILEAPSRFLNAATAASANFKSSKQKQINQTAYEKINHKQEEEEEEEEEEEAETDETMMNTNAPMTMRTRDEQVNTSQIDLVVDDDQSPTTPRSNRNNNFYFHSATDQPFQVSNIPYRMEPRGIDEAQTLIWNAYQNQLNNNPIGIFHPPLNYGTIHFAPDIQYLNDFATMRTAATTNTTNSNNHDPNSLNLINTNSLPLSQQNNSGMMFTVPQPISENEIAGGGEHLIRPSVILLPNSKHGNRGLNPEIVKLFPIFKHKANNSIATSTSSSTAATETEVATAKSTCTICLDMYKEDDDIRMLSCFHRFHVSCIDEWLLKSDTCPCCRVDLNRLFGMESRLTMAAIEQQQQQQGQRQGEELKVGNN